MSNVTVCARFRPLSSKEKRDHGESISIRSLESESFIFKDEKEEESTFSFDRVFYPGSKQADVYEILALPIVQDAINAINGTIITYGQTGAGKTYSMEGPSILDCDEKAKGLLPRVVDGLFHHLESADEMTKYTVKLSMVEIYMEKIRDLFNLSKDNLQIKEGKIQGIFLSGATEVAISDPAEALKHLSTGIANRAVGETQMNMASSRSHCAYIFTVLQELKIEKRLKVGKLILIDLAGSEKVEKTGAEGKVLEEAKTINKSLSALGNVINALTNGSPGKANHIPYRDSKLTRMLQDALGGNSRTALLCCCSPSTSNAAESMSTLRFGARAKHIKTAPRVNVSEEKIEKKQVVPSPTTDKLLKRTPNKFGETIDEEQVKLVSSPTEDKSRERILNKLGESFDEEQVRLLEELFILEGIFFSPTSVEDFESAYDDAIAKTILASQEAVRELECSVNKLDRENALLRAIIAAGVQEFDSQCSREYLGRLKKLGSWVIGSVFLGKLFR